MHSALLPGRFPVVAMGVLKWVDWTVSEPRYFQLQTDHTPVHLALLDEVGAARRSQQLCVLPSHVSSLPSEDSLFKASYFYSK